MNFHYRRNLPRAFFHWNTFSSLYHSSYVTRKFLKSFYYTQAVIFLIYFQVLFGTTHHEKFNLVNERGCCQKLVDDGQDFAFQRDSVFGVLFLRASGRAPDLVSGLSPQTSRISRFASLLFSSHFFLSLASVILVVRWYLNDTRFSDDDRWQPATRWICDFRFRSVARDVMFLLFHFRLPYAHCTVQ